MSTQSDYNLRNSEHRTDNVVARVSRSQSSFKASKGNIDLAWTSIGCGESTTLNKLSPLTNPNPACVDCRLLMACRISPSALKTSAARPSSLYSTFSASMICSNLFTTCASVKRAYRRIVHQYWSGSMVYLTD
jgi:hypothetical protein